MIKKISMHDFTQATHAFSAQLILTNNNLCRISLLQRETLLRFLHRKVIYKTAVLAIFTDKKI